MPPTTGATSDSEAAASPSPTPTRPAEPRVSAKFGALPTPRTPSSGAVSSMSCVTACADR